MKVKSESEVIQSCPTPSNPMDCSPPGPSVHGIFQARVLEWGAIAFSAGSYKLAFSFEFHSTLEAWILNPYEKEMVSFRDAFQFLFVAKHLSMLLSSRDWF